MRTWNKVVGIGAKPLAGITVKAFTSSIPDEDKKSSFTQFADRGRYPFPGKTHATLTHATAVSDAQGVARFTELTVAGTSDNVVYISFFANGKLLSWSNPSGDAGEIANPSFKAPWILHGGVAKKEQPVSLVLDVTVVPSPEVTEGQPFERQPVVKVTPARAGRIVYAMVTAKDGVAPPGKMTSPFGKPEIAIKRLVNAKATTNKDGIAIFDNLAFQVGGNAGNYHIEFWCDAHGSGMSVVKVVSSIAKVQVGDQSDPMQSNSDFCL